MKTKHIDLFEPRDVLYEYDGPRLFTFLDEYGDHLLAYLYEEESSEAEPEFLAVPFDEAGVEQLRNGQLTIREALAQPRWIWKVRGTIGGSAAFERTSLSSLDPATLPGINSVIRAALLPLLSLRVKGERIKANNVPPSVIRQAVSAAESAIRDVSNYIADVVGDADNCLRVMRDLSVQRLGFGSFEIALQSEPPNAHLDGPNPITEVSRMLTQAVQAASKQQPIQLANVFRNDEEGEVALEAIHDLTPPEHGAIEETEVSGRLVGSARGYPLNRSARNYVRGFIKSMPDDIINQTGRIEELDKGKETFTLRDIEGAGKDQKYSYPEEKLSDVLEAFSRTTRVRVIGKRHSANRPPSLLALLRAD